jgi:hypothetical protein
MEEKELKTENTDNKQTERPWLWKPGQSGNPAGRPKGAKNFTTLFEKAVKEVAKKLELGEDPDSVEVEIIKRGIKEALAGKYQFYKDIFDRIYGMPRQNIGVEGKIINIHIDSDIAEKNNVITPSTEDSSEGQS